MIREIRQGNTAAWRQHMTDMMLSSAAELVAEFNWWWIYSVW